MGLSISPSSFLKLFVDKKHRTKDKVADYLDSIAAEARALAEVWDVVVTELANESKAVNVHTDDRLTAILREFKEPNAPHFCRLRVFYKELRLVTDGKLPAKHQENIASALSNLLFGREVTLKRYQDTVRGLQQSVFVDDESTLDDFQDLAKLCNALHREAAAIEVLAKTVRAQAG